ncbi:MAG: PAS-domain containing protein [Alphaproteobacteria bacterium]|nr:PAS-domain containing protein [Alphaproteobacteria bacterium]
MQAAEAPATRQGLVLAGLDHINQGITIFDRRLRLVACNRKLIELLEFPPDLAKPGTHFSAFMRYNAERGEYGPGDPDEMTAERVRQAQSFQPHFFERLRPNGRIIQVRGDPVPGGGFVAVYTDVTEQRQHERQIHEEKIGLESRLRLITDAVPALIAYVDRDLCYQFANKGYAEWFGYSKTGIIGKRVAEVLGTRLWDEIGPHLRRALTGDRVSYEYENPLPTGLTVHARSTVVPEIGEGDEVVGLFVLSFDITEQKKAQAALIKAQQMEAVGQLTGGLAHDFNNLLTIIIGNLSAMAERPGSAALSDMLEPALGAARRGAELTRRLLAFSRRQSLEPVTVEVDGLVAGMVRMLRRSLKAQVEIVLSARGEPLFALVDQSQLENALLNLALNARDAMPGGGRLSIATAAARLDEPWGFDVAVPAGDYVQIVVEDDGCGMDAATVSRAFEPFFTTKEVGAGSGLGLSMVYGFVKQSGGFIRLDSAPGQGTRVTILLPAAPPPQDGAEPAPLARPPKARSRLVLLVEDERDVRAVIRRQLTDLGHKVLEAGDGHEALALLAAVEEVEVLVSDVLMPGGIDGVTLARRARELRPDLAVTLISGWSDEREGGGGFPLLRKPFDAEALGAMVDR